MTREQIKEAADKSWGFDKSDGEKPLSVGERVVCQENFRGTIIKIEAIAARPYHVQSDQGITRAFARSDISRQIEHFVVCPRCGATVLKTSYGTRNKCGCGCRWWAVDVAWLNIRVDELTKLLNELTDDSECRYDHHGYCQEHSLGSYPCPHERAKKLIGKGRP